MPLPLAIGDDSTATEGVRRKAGGAGVVSTEREVEAEAYEGTGGAIEVMKWRRKAGESAADGSAEAAGDGVIGTMPVLVVL